jgi:hypothetical protein
MLHVVIGDNKKERGTSVSNIISELQESEIIRIDDTTMRVADLEQFLFPSLFSIHAPVIHAQFFLEAGEIDTKFIKKLSASPTVFIFEEFSLPTTLITKLKSEGAILQSIKTNKEKKQPTDIFAVTGALTGKDKKSRWLAYRSALAQQPVEAILGILYWKLRTLASKEKSEGEYTRLYKTMLHAHAHAWKKGIPLALAIEKVILEQ